VKLFILFFVSLLVGFLLTVGVRYGLLIHQVSENHHHAVISPTVLPTSAYSLENAPKASLRGRVSSMTGSIHWQSRTATDSAALFTPHEIQQGEILQTDDPLTATISLLPNTRLEIIQTLPSEMVFKQDSGSTVYAASSEAKLSVRSLHLLTEVDGGETKIVTDNENGTVDVSVTSGTAKVSFNDQDNTTSVTTVKPMKTLVFSDDTRTISLR
jgi:hypothetical protein